MVDPIEEEAKNAASRIADAEAKCYLALEAAKQADNIAKLAEDTEAFLSLAKEIYDRCMSFINIINNIQINCRMPLYISPITLPLLGISICSILVHNDNVCCLQRNEPCIHILSF